MLCFDEDFIYKKIILFQINKKVYIKNDKIWQNIKITIKHIYRVK